MNSDLFRSAAVAIVRSGAERYPTTAPFDPSELYPEMTKIGGAISPTPNPVYSSVRQALLSLGLDASRAGTPEWNPFRNLIRTGDRVVVKPNLICQGNWNHPERWEEVFTHPSVIRPVVDYALLALDGSGSIVIADGPQTDSDLGELLRRSGLDRLLDHYAARQVDVTLLDLRRDRWFTKGGVTERREKLPGDPRGYVSIDLGDRSAFRDYTLNGRIYGADYDMEETRRFHSDGKHQYVLCRTVMDGDVFINLPKLKTHKKTGITISLKNLVGVNGYRNCLPHHTMGSPRDGGDEFPDSGLKRSLEGNSIRAFKKTLTMFGGLGGPIARGIKSAGRTFFGDSNNVVRSGNWSGNDTAWRMVLDLNLCLLWYDGEGKRLASPRRYFSLVDGIVGGDGNGPLAPDPVTAGLIIAGTNPWAVDWAAACEMGLRSNLIPLLQRPLDSPASFEWLLPKGGPDVRLTGSRNPRWRAFKPHFGWRSIADQPEPVER